MKQLIFSLLFILAGIGSYAQAGDEEKLVRACL